MGSCMRRRDHVSDDRVVDLVRQPVRRIRIADDEHVARQRRDDAAAHEIVDFVTPRRWTKRLRENPPLVRAYSLAAPPAASGELVLCLDRVPGGLGSEYLFGVREGDEIRFQGPQGNFVLPDPASEVRLAGVGRGQPAPGVVGAPVVEEGQRVSGGATAGQEPREQPLR